MTRKKTILSPTYTELITPVFEALVNLGGSGSNDEIRDSVIKSLDMSEIVVDELHNGLASQRTEFEYQLAWTRTYLKKYGAIINSKRGIWIITPEFADKTSVDSKEVVRIASITKVSVVETTNNITNSNIEENTSVESPDEAEPWRGKLAETLHKMNPYAFERLTQLLLRECGFDQVHVTKKSGDGGIDGTGKLRIIGIFSFNVAFQCKRYADSVSASDIRDFRGSLTADIEKGVFITTGVFTKAAREEASNSGKKQLDLIDGEEFIDKLIECRIGVFEKVIFDVDNEFYSNV